MIFLGDNVMVEEDLTFGNIKPRLLGMQNKHLEFTSERI